MLILYFLIILDIVEIGPKSISLIINNVAIKYIASKSGSHLS
jgi:hypothetical protein